LAGKTAQETVAKIREILVDRAVSLVAPQFERELEEQGFRPRDFVASVLDYLLSPQAGAPASGRSFGPSWRGKNHPATPILSSAEELATRNENAWEIIKELCHLVTLSLPEVEEEREDSERETWRKKLHELQLMLCEACLEGQLKRHMNLVERLREIERFPDTIASTLDPGTLTRVGLGRLKQMLDVDRALFLEVESRRRLVPVIGDLRGEERPLELDEVTAERLIRRGEPVYFDRGPEDGAFLRDRWGGAAALFLPLVARGRTQGVVLLVNDRGHRRISPVELELAERFANRLGVALENARLHSREQRKIKETVSLLELTRTINSTLDLEEVLDKVARMTVDLCGVVLCVAYLTEGDRLYPRAWAGFIEDVLWAEERRRGFRIGQVGEEETRLLSEGRPVNLSYREAAFALPPDILYEHGVGEVYLIPLRTRERLSGLLALFYPSRGGRGPDEEELELVNAVAAQASMAVENASLYEDIERSYFSTVQALAKAIEVKDPYTRGHSERVTAYALMIAEAMGLDEMERQKLKYAATLHDIGKIGIAGRVLNKPGALTEEEYSHVKTHPALGDSIIEPVEFLQAPRPIILHHHERYDGKGYPQGLKGEEIPLAARILSVADAFEAMRSDRPYRRALPLEEARKELLRNSGTQFDPRVVEKFLEILDRCGGDPVNR